MRILVLHVSDIHFNEKSNPILDRVAAIVGAISRHIATADLTVIAATGDISNTGSQNELSLASKFFVDLLDGIKKETHGSVGIVISPGNHDCDLSKNDNARSHLISVLTSDSAANIDESVVDICTKVQQEFLAFRNRLEEGQEYSDDKLWRTTTFTLADDRTVQFDALNVSWVSKIREDKNLFFPIAGYMAKAACDADLRLVLMHHPLNWYNQHVYRPIRKFVRTIANVVLTGHEHDGNAGTNDDFESSDSVYVEGRALQHGNGNLTETGFFLLELDPDNRKLLATEYAYHKGEYVPVPHNEGWKGYANLAVVNSNRVELAPAFKEKLTDPGAILKQSTFRLTLQDIFVYPDLRDRKATGKVRTFIDGSKLLDPDFVTGGVLLCADERVGSSSLLYQLFLGYIERGYYPILINGRAIKNTSEVSLDQLIDRAIKAQYATASTTRVSQSLRGSRVLFIDDLDESPLLNAEAQVLVLSTLLKKFDRILVTASSAFEIRELFQSDTNGALASMKHLEVQQFGFAKRAELVERWFSTGDAAAQTSDAELIRRCEEAERIISSAMHKSLIPSAPLYLLALLQSIESGKAPELKESALGHYYHYLLSEAFLTAGVPAAKLTEQFQFASHLAWNFHEKHRPALTREEISEFAARFSAEWTFVSSEKAITTLLSARVLQESGGEYRFKYPYMYYYLKSKYLRDHLQEAAIQDYVSHACAHLYVRDNANTILFLAHHTNDEWLLDQISASLRKLFSQYVPVTFEDDVEGITEIIAHAPQLTYRGGSPKDHRKARNRYRDEMGSAEEERSGDGLADAEEQTQELSLSAQLTMLTKTLEILGQVLKNQYSTIRRTKKQALIDELFSGSLRALSGFYSEVEGMPQGIIDAVKKKIAERNKLLPDDEKEKIARRYLAQVVQSLTCLMVMMPARNANSRDLDEDIERVVSGNGKLAYKLIQLAIRLDTANPLPRALLDELYGENKDDLVVSTLIQILVLNRLYMFKTSETDMQWLKARMGFDLPTQHWIAYQGQRQLN